jgi:hypothetical protein
MERQALLNGRRKRQEWLISMIWLSTLGAIVGFIGGGPLDGHVEIDETFVGGKRQPSLAASALPMNRTTRPSCLECYSATAGCWLRRSRT